MKICAYVQEGYAKANYKNECMETRQFAGLRVIIDALERAGYAVEWAGIATVHLYDIVLVSLTSDCDWWSYIGERQKWQKGNYKVIVGGAGVLHITPFLQYGDYFSFGRGESMGTDSLATVMLSAIAHRGKREDSENIGRLCSNKKFWNANSATKEATLSKYFDMDYLFSEFTPQTLPSKYLRTYCLVEKAWERPAWENKYAITPDV